MSKKEKCVNKKLHPYWKTGIYGWLGEEVDDNDYMCCPICGEILAMNYWDYSAEHDGDNKCPKCRQELDYSEIYDFEDTLYFKQLLEMKDEQIEQLEHRLSTCIEPKFKVGQEVWHCFKNCNEPAKTVIESIDIEVNEKFIDFTYYDIAGFGFDEIMLFTTEDEAEKHLEEIKNE